jgi:hypothetical protein
VPVTSRSYAPFTDKNIIKIGVLAYPETVGDYTDGNFDNYLRFAADETTPDPSWIDESTVGPKVVAIRRNQSPGAGTVDYWVQPDESLVVGDTYTLTVTGDCSFASNDQATFDIYHNGASIATTGAVNFPDTEILTATFVAVATTVKIRVRMNTALNASNAILRSPSLTKTFGVDYTIVESSETEVLITQEGFDGTPYLTADPDTFNGYEVEFEGNTTMNEGIDLINDPRKKIVVDGTNVWASEINWQPSTGKLRGIGITNFNELDL